MATTDEQGNIIPSPGQTFGEPIPRASWLEGQVYLTSEQLVRLAGLGLDALVGLQITSGTDPDSPAIVDLVDVDDPSRSRHFIVDPDGTFEETT